MEMSTATRRDAAAPSGDGRGGASGRFKAVAIAIIAASMMLAWWGRSVAIETRQDDAAYVLLGQSLGEGEYREIWLVDAPLHRKYPPAYPAMLEIAGTVLGDRHGAWLAVGMIGLLGTLILAWQIGRKAFGDRLALAGLASFAFNPGLLQYSGEVASEPMYMGLTMVALALLATDRPLPRHLLLAVAAAGLATISRLVGAALLAALLIHWLMERRYRAAAWLTATSALTLVAWVVWTALAPPEAAGESYALPRPPGGAAIAPTTLLSQAVTSGTNYLRDVLSWTLAVPTIPGTPVDNLIMLVVVLAGSAVGLALLWRKSRAAMLYILLYGAILLQWWAADRLLVPILPILVPAMIAGLYAIGRRVREPLGWTLAIGMALALSVNGLVRTVAQAQEARACEVVDGIPTGGCLSEDQESFFQALRYIRDHTPEDARVYTAKPEPLNLFTGRQAPSREVVWTNAEGFRTRLQEAGVDYILAGALHHSERRRLPEHLTALCSELTVEAMFPPRTWLFRVGPGSVGACDAAAAYATANENLWFGEAN